MSKNPNRETTFRFKQFEVSNTKSAMKIGTDGVLLGAWARLPQSHCKIMDVGAGTGVISLIVAQRCSQASIAAIEISEMAADECRDNFLNSPFSRQLEVINSDVTQYHTAERFDLIISNPPFFNQALRSNDTERATARSEGSLSATFLLKIASQLLSDDGQLAMITPTDRANDIIYEATMQRLHLCRRCDVVSVEGKQPVRTLWQFSRQDVPLEQTTLKLRSSDNQPTDDYRKLVDDFYIKI
jgi:tRNA1Val (adenine37-N6)-methyltransferase